MKEARKEFVFKTSEQTYELLYFFLINMNLFQNYYLLLLPILFITLLPI